MKILLFVFIVLFAVSFKSESEETSTQDVNNTKKVSYKNVPDLNGLKYAFAKSFHPPFHYGDTVLIDHVFLCGMGVSEDIRNRMMYPYIDSLLGNDTLHQFYEGKVLVYDDKLRNEIENKYFNTYKRLPSYEYYHRNKISVIFSGYLISNDTLTTEERYFYNKQDSTIRKIFIYHNNQWSYK